MSRNLLLSLVVIQLSACSSIPFFDKEKNNINGATDQNTTVPMVIVTVKGVDEPVAENVRAHVGISSSRCTVPVELLKRRTKKTLNEANVALQAFGYYEAEVSISFSSTSECPAAEIKIVPGRRMQVKKVDLIIEGEAASDPEFNRLLRDLPIQEGKYLNHADYSRTKSRIESAAAELGYLDGRFVNSTLKIYMESYSAEALFQFNSGDRYKLGEINIHQDPQVLREDLVRRLMEAPVGENYHADEIVEIQDRLSTSGYFKQVEARPRLSATKDKTVPIDVTAIPSERHKFSASFGFATDEGFRSRLGYTNRWWNDRGHRLGGDIHLSQTEQGISANYQIPREHPSDEWLRFTSGFRQRDVDTFQTLEARISANESKRRPWGIMENRFVSISREDFDIGDEHGIGTFLIPGIRWERRVVDDELYPEKGLDLSLEFRGATDALLADTSFIRTSFHAHYLRALGFGFRSFLRGDLGAIWVDQFRSLPPSERFFAGGDNSIRGYDFQKLGPVNNTGNVIGGSYLGIISFELEKYLTEKWGVAGFVDTGNAFGGPGTSTGLKTGVGIGLRWRSPVGPVRLDLAHPLDDNDTLFRIHLRIGPDL